MSAACGQPVGSCVLSAAWHFSVVAVLVVDDWLYKQRGSGVWRGWRLIAHCTRLWWLCTCRERTPRFAWALVLLLVVECTLLWRYQV